MKLKRVLATVLSAAMVLSCLAGCGSSAAESADTSKSDANASQAAEAAKVDDSKLDGTTIYLPDLDYTDATVYSPEMGEKMEKI